MKQDSEDRLAACELALKVLASMQRAYCATFISTIEGKPMAQTLAEWDKLYADTVRKLTGGEVL